MKSAVGQRVLGIIGVTGCSLPIVHTLYERGAEPWYFLFLALALLGAFVIGAARDVPERDPRKRAYRGPNEPPRNPMPKDYPNPPRDRVLREDEVPRPPVDYPEDWKP